MWRIIERYGALILISMCLVMKPKQEKNYSCRTIEYFHKLVNLMR